MQDLVCNVLYVFLVLIFYSLKSRIVLPFWCQLTQADLEKGR